MAAPFRKRAQAPVYDDKRDGFGYSALFDRHLQEFYASPARRRQLREARVLTKHGVVVDDQTFKRREEKVERKQREAQKRHESMRRDAAAQAEQLRKEKQDRREKKLLLHIAKERATKAKDKRLEPGSPKVAMHQTFGRTATSQRHSAGSPGFRDLKAETTTKRREASGPVGRRVVSSSTTPIQGGGRHVVSRSRPRPLTSSSRDRAHYSTTSQASSKRDSEAVPRATKLPVSGTLRTARYRSPGRARPASAAAYATTTVTMRYIGPFESFGGTKIESDDPSKPNTASVTKARRDKTSHFVFEQHTPGGGQNVVVYEGHLKLGAIFTFSLVRKPHSRLGVTIYKNSLISERMSNCCAHRYRLNSRIGGATGEFCLLHVSNSKPCVECQVSRRMSENLLNEDALSGGWDHAPATASETVRSTGSNPYRDYLDSHGSESTDEGGLTPEPDDRPETPEEQESIRGHPTTSSTSAAEPSTLRLERDSANHVFGDESGSTGGNAPEASLSVEPFSSPPSPNHRQEAGSTALDGDDLTPLERLWKQLSVTDPPRRRPSLVSPSPSPGNAGSERRDGATRLPVAPVGRDLQGGAESESEGIDMYALISHVEEIDGFDSPSLSPEDMPRPHAHHSPHLGDTMDFRTAADLDELDGLLSPELGGIEFDGERAMYDRNGANNPRGSTLDEVPPGGSVATASVTSPNNGVQPAAVEEEEEKEENEEAGSNPDQPSIALRAATADTTGGAPSSGMSRPDSASSRLGSRPGSARRSISTTPSTRNVDISPVVPDTTLITTASLAAATLETDETPARRQQGEGEWTMNVDSLRANPAAPAAGAGGDGEGPRSSKNPLSPSSIAHEIRKGRDGFMRVDTINEEVSTDLNASFHSVKSAEVPPEDAEEGRDAVSSAAPPEEHEESLEPAGEFAVSSDSGTEVEVAEGQDDGAQLNVDDLFMSGSEEDEPPPLAPRNPGPPAQLSHQPHQTYEQQLYEQQLYEQQLYEQQLYEQQQHAHQYRDDFYGGHHGEQLPLQQPHDYSAPNDDQYFGGQRIDANGQTYPSSGAEFAFDDSGETPMLSLEQFAALTNMAPLQ